MATVVALAVGRNWASGVIHMLNIVTSSVTRGPEVESRTGGDTATTVDSEVAFVHQAKAFETLGGLFSVFVLVACTHVPGKELS
jgi:hypothetical protein